MKFRSLFPIVSLLLAGYAAPVFGQAFTPVAPEAAGFSPDRLARIDSVIMNHIRQNQIAGVVTLITRDGKAVQLKSYGYSDIEQKKPMSGDAIFRIASMSKAVTSIAVMMLYEEGHFLLNDPVSKYIPEFADPVVSLPAPEGSPDTVKFATVKANRPITIRHLLTHTSGLTYGDDLARDVYKKAGLNGWYLANKNEPIGDVVRRMAEMPLAAQPGENYLYGYSTDVLGYLVEVVSGMPLDRFFEERIFKPLKMNDTYFFLPKEKVSRFTPVYGIEDGQLVKRESPETSDYVVGPRKCFSGGAGLLSTITDYGRLLQMLLNEGELDGVRILSPKTVELMHADHVGERYNWDRRGFGLGFWVVEDMGENGELMSEGAYGWGSAYYPQYWVDPQEHLTAIIMTQLMPTGGLNLNERFKVLTYQAMTKSYVNREKATSFAGDN